MRFYLKLSRWAYGLEPGCMAKSVPRNAILTKHQIAFFFFFFFSYSRFVLVEFRTNGRFSKIWRT
jgi:hypothetical protein